MTAFEYLSVLLSIILGLAITHVLEGYRGLLLARKRVRRYWPSLIWSALILLFTCQAWWASFGLDDRREWRFDVFLVIVGQMALIYMAAALVLPDARGDEPVDLRAHYETQRRPFFAVLLLTVIASLLKDLMLDGALPEGANLGFHVLLAATALAGIFVARHAVQWCLALGMCVLFTGYIALLFARL